jgi:hypothetical protein
MGKNIFYFLRNERSAGSDYIITNRTGMVCAFKHSNRIGSDPGSIAGSRKGFEGLDVLDLKSSNDCKVKAT